MTMQEFRVALLEQNAKGAAKGEYPTICRMGLDDLWSLIEDLPCKPRHIGATSRPPHPHRIMRLDGIDIVPDNTVTEPVWE